MAKSPGGISAFTLKRRGRANKILTSLGISVAFDPKKPPSPSPKIHEVQALWDTGATGSVISPGVVKALSLHATGTAKIHGVGGVETVNTYVVNLYLPNKLGVIGVIVNESRSLAGFGAIVGMDIITQGDFAITNAGGNTCVSFRYPSVHTVDFVQQANQMKSPTARRNAPCPCGSTDANGKPRQYKRCCGKKSAKKQKKPWPER